MLKLKFHTYLITMQNVNTGLYRTFFLQAEAAGQFWGFVSVLPLFSLSKCEVPNFGPLYSKLGELNIQNSLACFTYNIPGTSSSNFIGFWGIDIWADFEGTRPSCTPVHSVSEFFRTYLLLLPTLHSSYNGQAPPSLFRVAWRRSPMALLVVRGRQTLFRTTCPPHPWLRGPLSNLKMGHEVSLLSSWVLWANSQARAKLMLEATALKSMQLGLFFFGETCT